MKRKATVLSEQEQKKMTRLFWVFALLPFVMVLSLFLLQSEEDLPPVSMLDNPPELQASLILAKKSIKEDTVIGRFWQVNRTSIKYREISPFVTDALISTEDERFMQHAGVDFRALARSLTSFGRSGGASTIPQQLAKLLFTLQQRQRQEIARASGARIELPYVGGLLGKFRRVGEKARENIIAKRLEERFTKVEIITMYLNQFDFLYNAVGIESAARVYFNKRPKDLNKSEAATLVGLCKNPTIYNPYSYQIRNYRARIAENKGIALSAVTKEEILAARAKDSTIAHSRRNQVLFQWLKNSEKSNEALRTQITREEYNQLIKTPIVVHYRSLDHKEGMAPYFRKELRTEVQSILLAKKADGTFKYLREDGNTYNIDADGLKIYTTLNPTMQRYAEAAVERHIFEQLQPQFDLNNKGLKNYPFSNSIKPEIVEQIMTSARHNSDRYKKYVALGFAESEINQVFNEPVEMTVFSLKGERDTVMSPNDSIRYYKAFLHAGMVSVDPRTGFVKAWVGGINFKHFGYDHVRQGKRQVGSTIKPFVYAAALSMKVVNPCTGFSADEYCLKLLDHNTNKVVGQYCPAGPAAPSVKDGLAQSSNKVTVAVMGRMGSFNPVKKTGGPYQIEKLLKKMEINLQPNDVVPSMCLGSMDLSLLQMVAAQCILRSCTNAP